MNHTCFKTYYNGAEIRIPAIRANNVLWETYNGNEEILAAAKERGIDIQEQARPYSSGYMITIGNAVAEWISEIIDDEYPSLNEQHTHANVIFDIDASNYWDEYINSQDYDPVATEFDLLDSAMIGCGFELPSGFLQGFGETFADYRQNLAWGNNYYYDSSILMSSGVPCLSKSIIFSTGDTETHRPPEMSIQANFGNNTIVYVDFLGRIVNSEIGSPLN